MDLYSPRWTHCPVSSIDAEIFKLNVAGSIPVSRNLPFCEVKDVQNPLPQAANTINRSAESVAVPAQWALVPALHTNGSPQLSSPAISILSNRSGWGWSK